MKSTVIVLMVVLLGLLSSRVQAAFDFRLYGISTDSGDVVEFDKTAGETRVISRLPFPVHESTGFDSDPWNAALVATTVVQVGGGTQVKRINPDDGTVEGGGSIQIIGGGTQGLGMYDAGGAYIFNDGPWSDSNGSLLRVNLAVGLPILVSRYPTPSSSTDALKSVVGGDYDPGRNLFWAADSTGNRLYSLRSDDGAILSESQAGFSVGDVDVTINGQILVADVRKPTNGPFRIMEYHPDTDQWTEFLVTDSNESFRIASIPFLIDRDHDGLGDDVETNTRVFQSDQDTGSDPDNPDTDGDGLGDWAEVFQHLTDPNDPDSDHDGFLDRFEVSTGFDPNSGLSVPDTTSEFHTAVEFRFGTQLGNAYRVEASVDLENWENIETDIAGTGDFVVRFYSVQETSHRFFRARNE